MTSLETVVHRSRKLRPRTKEVYLRHIRAFLAFAGQSPENWTSETVNAWCQDMQNRQVKSQSINVALNALRFAAQEDVNKLFKDVERLPVKQIKSPPSKKDRALSWKEGRRLVIACGGARGRDLRDCAIITLGLRTGMLRFSICQLRFEDLRNKPSLSFPSLTFTKRGGDRHTILLDNVTYAALQTWIDWLTTHEVHDGFIFRSLGRRRIRKGNIPIGDELTPDGLYRVLHERAKQARLDGLTPHIFRKTFLAWCALVNAKPGQIEAVTGHKLDGAGGSEWIVTLPANMLFPTWDEDLLKRAKDDEK